MVRLPDFLAGRLGKVEHIRLGELEVLVEVGGGHDQHALAEDVQELTHRVHGRDVPDREFLLAAVVRNLLEKLEHGPAPFLVLEPRILVLEPRSPGEYKKAK